MIDYELATYAAGVLSNFLSGITVYFSIITAYVITDFVAGERLSRLQLSIVNLCFTIAAGIIGPLSVLMFSRFNELVLRLQDFEGTPSVNFTAAIALLNVILYVGSLVFMFSTRKR